MAYETGGAASRDALLQAIAVFAAAQGWTVHFNGNRTGAGAGLGYAIIISKAGQCHTTFRTHNANRVVESYGHDAYNPAYTSDNQPNFGSISTTNEVNGPLQAYHLFAGNTYLYCVAETEAGIFKHFGCGILETFGSVTPAHFVYGTSWNYGQSRVSDPLSNGHGVPLNYDGSAGYRNTSLRADYDGVANRWNVTTNNLAFLPEARSDRLTKTSAYTQRATLAAPVWLLLRASSLYSPAGIAPNWRTVLLDWIAPGDNLTLGSDVWKVFPIIRRNGGVGEPDSGTFGYAYKT